MADNNSSNRAADSAKDPTFSRPPTAQEAVASHIRKHILEGEWRPGEFIRQDQLAAKLGVSRVPIREALRILEADGLVQYHPHRGHAVVTLRIDDLRDIYRLRQLVENETVADATAKLTDSSLANMEDAMLEMESAQPKDISTLTTANRRFHFALFEAADRPRLISFLNMLWDSSDLYRSLYYLEHKELDTVNREHRAIYEACLARNETDLVRLLETHLVHAISLLEGVVGKQTNLSTHSDGDKHPSDRRL